jgi:xylulokinase
MGNTDDLILALDVGTSSCKAAAINLLGQKMAEFATEYPTAYPRFGYAEQNPEDWKKALGNSITRVVENIDQSKNHFLGLTVSSHGPTLVLMDEEGLALKPAQTWQDFRCIPQGERLVKEIEDRKWIGLGGTKSGIAAKLLWAKDNWPVEFNRCRWVGGVKEFILLWLTGEIASEPSSGPGSRVWSDDVFEFIGIPVEKLPPIYSSLHQIGYLKPRLAASFRLPDNLPVFMGLNDGASSTLGAGAYRPGDACISLGTNGVGRLILDRPFDSDLGMKMNAFFWPYIPDRWVVGGMSITGGSCLSWARDCMGSSDYDGLIELAERSGEGSHGVIFIPFLNGRGMPNQNEKARAAYLNLQISTGQGDLVRAIMEGVAFSIREIFDAMQSVGYYLGDIRITGGGAKIALWRDIISNVLNRNVMLGGGDATLGGAILTSVASGCYAGFDEAVQEMVHNIDLRRPSKQAVDIYEELFRTYKTSIEQLGY